MAENEELEQRAVERLTEDERLRGELTDFGYEPLLKWATEAVSTFVNSHPVTEQEVDDYTSKIRNALSSIVALASSGKLADSTALTELDLPTDQKQALVSQVQTFQASDDPDANAEGLAAILEGALKQTASQAQAVTTEAVAQLTTEPTADVTLKKNESISAAPSDALPVPSEPAVAPVEAQPNPNDRVSAEQAAPPVEPIVEAANPTVQPAPANAAEQVVEPPVAPVVEKAAATLEESADSAAPKPETPETGGLNKFFGSVKNFFLGKSADEGDKAAPDTDNKQEAEK